MRIKRLIRKAVLDAPLYHLEEYPGIKLNQNESPWDLPVPIKVRVVEDLLKVPWNRYPLGDLLLLKKRMARFLGVWPDNLVLANGSNVLIQALIIAASVEQKVMVPDPSFGVYAIEAELLGNKVHRIDLNEDFSIPESKFLQAIRRGRPGIIFIPNPNAPTGTLFDLESIRKIIEAAPCLVVIDEAYFPFSGTTVIDWVREYDNLVVLRTFSKAYALSGLRLGFMIADPDVAQQVQKCILPFCMNRLTFVAAMTVLDSIDYSDDFVKKISAERERVYWEMNKIQKIKVYPSHTNFLLFEVKKAEDTFRRLLKLGIVVRQINDGRRLTNTLRVTLGTREENNSFLSAIEKAL